MNTQTSRSADEDAVRALYHDLLDGWNRRDAAAFTAPFAVGSEVIGFDGSHYNGRAETAEAMQRIFTDHPTVPYVSVVKNICLLGAETAMLRAIAGMVLPGQSDIAPALNTHQTLVAARVDGAWRIVLFQNTPALFHGQPERVERMTEELRQARRAASGA